MPRDYQEFDREVVTEGSERHDPGRHSSAPVAWAFTPDPEQSKQMPMATAQTFRRRILRAGTWTLSGHAASQVLRLANNLIMTRLLAPEWFGIMALASVIMVGLSLFSDIGLAQGIIQSRRGHDPKYLNTAWTVQILRGSLIWMLALAIGGGVALLGAHGGLPPDSAYAAPILPYVIAALSFNALFDGFASTRLATASRNLNIGRVTLIELGSQLLGTVCMIGWALADRSIWALVVGSLCATLLRVGLSHTILPGEKNRLAWDTEAFLQIFSFGKWIFLTSILGFLAASGDRLILGGLTDPSTLGLYAIAFFLVEALRNVFQKIASNVAFPALSEVARERRADLKKVYYQFRLPIDAAALVAMGMLLSCGQLIVDILYDARYEAAGGMVGILGLLLFEARYSTARQCFLALGKPILLVPTKLLDIALLFSLMLTAFHAYGLSGAIWAVPIAALLTLPLTFYLKISNGIFDLRRELLVLPFSAIGYLLGYLLTESARWIGLAP